MHSAFPLYLRFIYLIAGTLSPSTISLNSAFAEGSTKIEHVMGLWATLGFRSTVRLEPCEPKQAPIVLCGTITWLEVTMDDDETRLTDTRKPNKVVREHPLIGTRIVSGFRLSRDGVWRGGKIYNPEDGRSYSGTIRSTNSCALILKGCALKVFCKTQAWKRVSDGCYSVEEDDDE